MPSRLKAQGGFSLVELLVALVFTGVLMAGMSNVFKSSLSSFVTSGEGLSSTRRNRLAMDLLSDDLNSAGQYLALEAPPNTISETNPGFIINPKVPFTGTDIPEADAVTDELLFYFDEPVPFEGSFTNDVKGTASYVADGTATSGTTQFTMTFKSHEEAVQVKPGMMLVTRGNYEHKILLTATPDATGPTTVATISGFFNDSHIGGVAGVGGHDGEGLVIAKPAQYVRYRIVSQNWDPEKQSDTTGRIPCLIREQGNYPGTGVFTPDATLSTIVAENVTKFTVDLSVDRGVTWRTGDNWAAIKTALNTDLSASGAPGFKSISDPHWYRGIPILVRVNVTTRTARARSEYSPAGDALAYKEQTVSLVLLPRHFGLNF